jgi:hypothetical protein
LRVEGVGEELAVTCRFRGRGALRWRWGVVKRAMYGMHITNITNVTNVSNVTNVTNVGLFSVRGSRDGGGGVGRRREGGGGARLY